MKAKLILIAALAFCAGSLFAQANDHKPPYGAQYHFAVLHRTTLIVGHTLDDYQIERPLASLPWPPTKPKTQNEWRRAALELSSAIITHADFGERILSSDESVWTMDDQDKGRSDHVTGLTQRGRQFVIATDTFDGDNYEAFIFEIKKSARTGKIEANKKGHKRSRMLWASEASAKHSFRAMNAQQFIQGERCLPMAFQQG